MPDWLTGLVPIEGIKIALVLFLSFLIGLEREEHRNREQGGRRPSFGGVRTFPLIGLTGYGMALLSGDQLLLVAAGFLGVAGFLLLSYQQQLVKQDDPGATTEISGLVTYIVGALVSRGEFWIATTIAIVGLLLLGLKEMLEGLTQHVSEDEVLAFTKFLLLTAVILPVVPNAEFGSFGFNPFKAWLSVIAASAISYGSYLLQKLAKGRGGILLAGVLGGAYSSTMTTVVLAKRARGRQSAGIYAAGILMASGTVYLRVLVLVGLFNRALWKELLGPFIVLGCACLLGGWLWARKGVRDTGSQEDVQEKNPLELSAAFLFGALFTLLLMATHFAIVHFGRSGVYGLAGISGLADIDPFILGLTQSSGVSTPQVLAAAAIVIAVSSNNFMKGFYAFGFAGRKAGWQLLGLLWALAVLGLAPLAF